jgi:hypothetical protein
MILTPEWLAGAGEFISGVAGLLTAGAVIIFGIQGIRQYKHAQILKTADMLLEMEKEYRQVLPICLEFEIPQSYDEKIVPILKKIISGHPADAKLSHEEMTTLEQLDKAMRFFYVCSVLNGELHVEQNVIARVYYYYLTMLVDPGRREVLSQYVREFFPRLHAWLEEQKGSLNNYKKTGKWEAKAAAPHLEPKTATTAPTSPAGSPPSGSSEQS